MCYFLLLCHILDDRVVSGVWYFLLVCHVPCYILLKVSALYRTVEGSPVILVPGNRLAFLLCALGIVGGGVCLSRSQAGLWLPLCILFATGLFLVSVPASALGFPFGPLFRASVLKASQRHGLLKCFPTSSWGCGASKGLFSGALMAPGVLGLDVVGVGSWSGLASNHLQPLTLLKFFHFNSVV